MARHVIFNGEIVRNGELFTSEHPLMQGCNRMMFSWFVVSSTLPFYQDEFWKINYYAEKKGIILPVLFTAATFAQEINHLFQINRIYQGGILKLCMFVPKPGENAQYFMTAEPVNRQLFVLNDQGLMIDVFRNNRLFSGSAEVYDVGVSATETSAQNQMHNNRLDQLVLLNELNHVARFIGANFCMIKDMDVFFPNVKEGAINDVLREKTMLVCKNQNLNVLEDKIVNVEMLKVADEILVLDPVLGIRWVMGFQDKRYYYLKSPNIHKEINLLYFGKS